MAENEPAPTGASGVVSQAADPAETLGVAIDASTAADIVSMLRAGKTGPEIVAELHVDESVFTTVKAGFLKAEGEAIKRRTTEETYVEYVLAQGSCIRKLETILEHWEGTNQATALVGAARAKSDILDKIIQRGQEFGLIERKPEEKRIIGGIAIGHLADPELRKLIVGEISMLQELTRRYGSSDITEVQLGPTHYAALPAHDDQPKTNRSSHNKVSGGRRVVKTRPAG